jgi:hypothetical protein
MLDGSSRATRRLSCIGRSGVQNHLVGPFVLK